MNPASTRRPARLSDGKDYFTIYDFVKAHLHFSDPEWDSGCHLSRWERWET